MPRILNYTPSWLSRPSPGFNFFADAAKNGQPSTNHKSAPNAGFQVPSNDSSSVSQKTLARRGTEVFWATGTEIRWADLRSLKADEEENDFRRTNRSSFRHSVFSAQQSNDQAAEPKVCSVSKPYTVLKAPVTNEIRQLTISPNLEYLAIITSHTAHIAILPDSSHLNQQDATPIRLKTHTLGPTAHVLNQSPIISVLWHPLGVLGNAFITITAEAVVRLWELNRENRWSFDSPALSVDLKLLADGTSSNDDFGASTSSMNKGFSPDSVEMEIAAACFGGDGSDDEHGWGPMTLWVAMKEGDIYALCPFLPSKWQPPATLVPSLSVSVVTGNASFEKSLKSDMEIEQIRQQVKWLTDIDNQDPYLHQHHSGYASEVYERPVKPGALPKLQGPFQLEGIEDDDEDGLLTDIFVVGAKLESDELPTNVDFTSDISDDVSMGLSFPIICVARDNGRVHICLDLEGVEAKWLPEESKTNSFLPRQFEDPQALLCLETFILAEESGPQNTDSPVFSRDPVSRYSFFVTHSDGVSYFSMKSWVERIEEELANEGNAGTNFRVELLAHNSMTLREDLLKSRRGSNDDHRPHQYVACVVFQDFELGYFLLTVHGHQPVALTLDSPVDRPEELDDPPTWDFSGALQELSLAEPRSAYQAPESLWEKSSMPDFLNRQLHDRYRRIAKEEIRLSPMTLDLLTEAHRVISQETYRLGLAAADIFSRCKRLQDEFRDQISRANEVANRVEEVVGINGEDRTSMDVSKRIELVKERQETLKERHDALRRTLGRLRGQELSEQEQAWMLEVRKLQASVEGSTTEDEIEEKGPGIFDRYEQIKGLKSQLTEQAQEIVKQETSEDDSGGVKIPSDIRKAKLNQVMQMLERESALVDAARARLERLNLSAR